MRKQSAGLLVVVTAIAQTWRPGPQVASFHSAIDDSEQPYALYVPPQYDPSRRYPLVIALHGAGSDHRLNLRRVFGRGNAPGESEVEATRYFPPLPEVDYLVASPYARGTLGFQDIGEQDVYDVLADVKRRFSVDEDRIYLTGLSMGGGGTLWLGLTKPDVWAALAAVCPAPPLETEELAGNALHLPVHLFEGELDPIVPAASVRRWQKLFLDLGVRAEYKEYPNVRHNSWDTAYRNAGVFDWFARFRRGRYPARVRFSARQYKHGSAYWLRFDQIAPGALATVDASFTARNQLTLKTENLGALTLLLNGHPQFSPAQPLLLQLDGKRLRTISKGVVSLSKAANGWQAKPYVRPARVKGPGQEGPIREAIASRHTYVFGTSDHPSPEDEAQRRATAERAADWSTPASKLLLSVPVRADREMTRSDVANANLVLFGNAGTNSVLAQFAQELPLSLNVGAADFGLLFIAPLSTGHYALVSSGLPWWTGTDQVQRPGLAFLPPAYRLLASFPDYVVFRGSLEHIIEEGYFDDQWKVPAEVAERLRSTGAVEVR